MKTFPDTPHAHHRLAVLAICLLTVVIYSNSLNCGFIFDDMQNITQNPHIHLTHFDWTGLYDAALKSPMKNRPLANISFAVNYYLGRYHPLGYHLVNILIHLFNGILVYFLAILTFKQDAALKLDNNRPILGMSLLASLIFVAHPVQVQSVTYIVQRMNSMATLFYLLALVCYVQGRIAQIKCQQWIWWTGGLASWILALGSKEIAAVLPLTLFFYEWFFFQNLAKDWLKRNFKYLAGLIVLFALVVYIYLGTDPLDRILSDYDFRNFTLGERVLTQFRVLVYYLGLLLYPHPDRLNLLHDIPASHSLLDPPTTLGCMLIVAGLLGLMVFLAKKQRLISFGILWFFIHLLIESSIIGLELIFEHRLYLPMFGFAMITSYLLFHLLSQKKTLTVIVSAAVIVSLGSATYLRNKDWQNPITLWFDVVAKNPRSARAYYNLGSDLARQGRLGEALDYFFKALALKPDYGKAHNNLGLTLFNQGKLDQAADHFTAALRIHPGNAAAYYNLGLVWEKKGNRSLAFNYYSKALQIKPDFAQAHNSLGILLQEQGRYQQAADHFSKALEIEPDMVEAHQNMGSVLEMQRDFKQAIDHYFAALQIRLDDARTYNNLGVALTRQGILEEAVRCYLEALRLKPDDAGVHNNLGVVLQRQGKLKEAADQYSAALRIKPDYAEAHNNLGIVLVQLGRFQEAVDHFSKVLQIRPDDIQARHNRELALHSMSHSNTDRNTTLP